MKINSIKGNGTNKYTLIIDDNKYIIYDDIIIKYNLLKCKTITDKEFESIINDNINYDLYIRMIKYITFKMRSEKEVINKLYSLGASKENIYSIINRLKEEKYIDNSKYIDSYIKDQINLTLNGPNKIKNNLLKLGFKEESINDLLNNIDSSIWQDKVNKVINKKINTLKRSKYTIINKLKVYLNNLGYDENHYKNLINKVDINDLSFLKKDYDKYYQKLSKKYEGYDLQLKLKQKLYSLGYKSSDINNLKEK